MTATNARKRTMILGAGPNQVPLIRKAVDLGHYVITVDYIPGNIGHAFSHRYVNCSTIDKEGVLRAAKELHIDAICTAASDIAIPTLSYVSSELSLPGISPEVAETISNKALFRHCQKSNNLNHPAFSIVDTLDDLRDRVAALEPPLIFKPIDNSGSRGVMMVDSRNPDICRTAFVYAQKFSRAKQVCIERFIPGVEVGGDGFLFKGEIVFCAITHKNLQGFIPTGHSFPTDISLTDQNRVKTEIFNNCVAVGYDNGPINFDVKVNAEQVVVIEMGARTGGNGIVPLIQRATGVDLTVALLDFAGGKTPVFNPADGIQGCGCMVIGAQQEGILQHIATEERIRKMFPQIFEFTIDNKIGDLIRAFSHSGNQIGRILFDCRDAAEYAAVAGSINQALSLRTAPEPILESV